jgi:AbrB family looped-hinge helix DNA binding protein
MKIKSFENITSFGTATIGKKGQVVIPTEIRKKLKIKTGGKFIVFLVPTGAVVFIPAGQFGKMVSEFDKKLAKFKELAK